MEIIPDQLLVEIEQCRKEMIQLASHSSYSNSKVVEISTKLDGLLNKYYDISESQKAVTLR
jgi:hypothetical protein